MSQEYILTISFDPSEGFYHAHYQNTTAEGHSRELNKAIEEATEYLKDPDSRIT